MLLLLLLLLLPTALIKRRPVVYLELKERDEQRKLKPFSQLRHKF